MTDQSDQPPPKKPSLFAPSTPRSSASVREELPPTPPRPVIDRGSALEALIAEMLGELGEVHSQVAALRAVLPDLVQETERSFQAMVSARVAELIEATRAERAAADAAQAEVSLAIRSIAKSTTAATIEHRAALDQHQTSLIEMGTAEIGRQASKMFQEVGIRWSLRGWRLAAAAIVLATTSAAIGAGGAWSFGGGLNSEQVLAIQAGRDVERAYALLDTATREKLIEAIRKTK